MYVEIRPSDGGVGARLKPSAFQKLFMTKKLSNLIKKGRNRSSTSSGDETWPLHEAKKLRDFTESADENINCDYEANDEIMEALSKIEQFGEQLNAIIARLSKLDIIEAP